MFVSAHIRQVSSRDRSRESSRSHWRSTALLCFFVGVWIAGNAAKAYPATLPDRRPNFLFIHVDDLGWSEVGCNRGGAALGFADTPHIDQLAAAGMRFTRRLMFYYPNFHMTTPAAAIRHGHWKLIDYLGQDRTELYNLADDLGEQNDLSSKLPDEAAALRKKLADHLRRLGAMMPRPNPNHDSKKADTWGPRIKGDLKWNNIP